MPLLSGQHIPIADLFTSVCGEGPTSGLKAFFVRFGKCTRKCVWCDAGFNKPIDDIKYVSFDLLARQLQKMHDEKGLHICFTGGEPSLFDDIIRELVTGLGLDDFSIETNGDNFSRVFWHMLDNVNGYFIISPKLNSSGKKSEIDFELFMFKNVYAKFVAANNDDIVDLHSILQQHSDKFFNDVYIQPVDNNIKLVEQIMSLDFGANIRLGCQMHKVYGLK